MVADDDAGPRRVLVVLLAVLSIVAASVLLSLVSLDRSVGRVEVDGLGGPEDDDPTTRDGEARGRRDAGPADPLTVLVLGSDSREVLSAEERRTLGTGHADGERTETIALVRLDPEADELRVLSVPRDTLLTRCDGSRGRVNAAYGIGERDGTGGMSCVVTTLTEWGGVSIDHAVKLDFRGFVDVVDALGGVPITLDEPLVDERANLDLPAGCTRLDGPQALAFVRARSLDSDFGRIQRQQRFMEELRREVEQLGLLEDLPRLYRTAGALARAVEVDSSLHPVRIQRLARQHRETVRAPVEGRSIPGRTETIDGIAFLRVSSDDVEEAFRWLEGGPAPSRPGHDAAIGEPDGPAPGARRPDDAANGPDRPAGPDAPPTVQDAETHQRC